jgi:multisubunit Na+/H+ antiporter MnhF subunit
MNIWLISAISLLLAFLPCAVVVLHSHDLMDQFIATLLAGVVTVMVMMLIAQGLNRPSFLDLAAVLALLAFPSCLLFARFLGRWLP